MKKLFLKTICLALFAAIFLTVASSCKKGSGDKGNVDEQKTLKIGVLREDDSSDEASAWEKYLKTVGKALNMTVDFTTTNSSSSEVSAINTYASKGYNAILLFSDDDFVASVSAAANKKMYVVSPTGHPTEEQYEQIKDNEFYDFRRRDTLRFDHAHQPSDRYTDVSLRGPVNFLRRREKT